MTRMWMVDPALLCQEHLLGEHKELHQLVGHVRAGNRAVIDGHAAKGQIDTGKIQERHDTLVAEMERRGFDHDSPLAYEDDIDAGAVDREESIAALKERCTACCERITVASRQKEEEKQGSS